MGRTRTHASRRWSATFAVLTTLTVVTVGCSSEEGDATTEPVGERPEPIESGMPEDPTPVRGGQVVYGLEAESENGWCLPEAQLAVSGLQVVRSIYDHLTVPDGEGGYVPYLARSVEPDEDFRVWTVQLRPNVTFHDGTPFNADVAKLNLDTYRGVVTDGPRRPSLFIFALANIDTITRVDDLTLRITLEVPQPAFPGVLYSSGRVAMVGLAQLNGTEEECAREPVGTGPFRFVSWEPNEVMRLRRWENYWLEAPDGEPYPYVDGIDYRPIPDGNARIAALQRGDINMMHSSTVGDLAGSLAQLRDDGAINLLISEVQTEVTYGIVNTTKPGLDDRETRLALARSLDRHRLNREANAGYATVADGPFAPGVLGHLEDPGFPEHDLDAARATVDRLKAEGRPTSFEFLTTITPANVRAAVIAQQMMQEAGFDISLVVVPEAELIDRVIAGEYDISAFRNQPGDDPDLNYVWWYGEANPVNFGRFDDPVVNEQLDIGRSSLDPEERRQAYETVNRRFAEQVYMNWLYFALWGVAEAPNVHGIVGPPLAEDIPAPARLVTGHPMTGVWIEDPDPG